MNNDRRKAITALIKQADGVQLKIQALMDALTDAKAEADDLKGDIEGIRDEEQEYFDNMPESLQSSERGQMAEAAVSQLEEAMSKLDELNDLELDFNMEDVVSCLESAKE